MASSSREMETLTPNSRLYWGAVWAGVFTFIAIWSVFEALGLSLFASSASSDAASVSVGLAIWSVILTVIAMFIAGRITGRLAGITNSREGAVQGMVMFGLSVTAALILFIGGTAFGRTDVALGGSHGAYVLGIFSNFGWVLFVCLFLGWLAALGGGSTAHKELPEHAAAQQQVRHA